MGNRVEVLPGDRYGNLVVEGEAASRRRKNGRPRRFVVCLCDCGQKVEVCLSNLLAGHTRSCGCLRASSRVNGADYHGMANSREYGIWEGMKDRCYKPRTRGYANYGGRGIKVCERWLHSFKAFYEDMGPRPSLEHSIDRIDGDGDYEPGNCWWATRAEQNRNRKDNRFLEFRGERLCLADWAKRCGMRKGTLHDRLARGMSVEEALTTPVRQWRRDPEFRLIPIPKRDHAWYREYARRFAAV